MLFNYNKQPSVTTNELLAVKAIVGGAMFLNAALSDDDDRGLRMVTSAAGTVVSMALTTERDCRRTMPRVDAVVQTTSCVAILNLVAALAE